MKRAYAVRRSRAADWARLCGGLAVPVLVLAALGARARLVPEAALLPVLVLGFVLGLAAAGIAIYALADVWQSGAEGAGSAIVGIVYATPALALLGLIAAAAIAYPRLSEVTTNYADPPQFVGVAVGDLTPLSPAAALQQQAYPDLVTHLYPLPLGQVYAAARDLMKARGWTIVRDSRPAVMATTSAETASAAVGETDDIARALAQKTVMTQSRGTATGQAPDAAAGPDASLLHSQGNVATLQATARTLLFGFQDDIVVRLRGTPEGTEVDVRSASEIGAHDLGQNARRVRAFFSKLDATLQIGPGGSSVSGIASAGQ